MPDKLDDVRALVKLAMCSGDSATCKYFNSCSHSKYGASCASKLRSEYEYVLNVLPTVIASTTGNKRDLTQQVYDVLLELGIPASVYGYTYLREAITMAAKDPSVIHGITKVLYPTIATRYNTTPSRVERNMRCAIDMAWERTSFDVLVKYFGYTASLKSGKPTVGEFVATIANHIRISRQ